MKAELQQLLHPRQPAKKLTPMKAIRAKCLDCCCGQFKEVRLCHLIDCSLWTRRLGRNLKPGDMVLWERELEEERQRLSVEAGAEIAAWWTPPNRQE